MLGSIEEGLHQEDRQHMMNYLNNGSSLSQMQRYNSLGAIRFNERTPPINNWHKKMSHEQRNKFSVKKNANLSGLKSRLNGMYDQNIEQYGGDTGHEN